MTAQLSPQQIAPIAVLVIIELGLLAAAWIVLFRTPNARLTLPKWAWALLCLVQFIGPLAFFAVGRKPKQIEEAQTEPDTANTTTRVVNDLYGK